MSGDPLVAFWSARLDETEAAAKEAAAETAAEWFADTSEEPDERSVCYTGPSTLHPGSVWDYRIADRVPLAAAGHIALHDPARVLGEVEADRKLIAAYEAARADVPPVVDWYEVDDGIRVATAAVLESVVKILVSAWSAHPEYRAEWAPSPGATLP